MTNYLTDHTPDDDAPLAERFDYYTRLRVEAMQQVRDCEEQLAELWAESRHDPLGRPPLVKKMDSPGLY